MRAVTVVVKDRRVLIRVNCCRAVEKVVRGGWCPWSGCGCGGMKVGREGLEVEVEAVQSFSAVLILATRLL